MFTGLIADLGRVQAVEADGNGVTLRIATSLASELGEGDSIAVNGVCLTATRVVGGGAQAAGTRPGEAQAAGGRAGEFEAQAIRETLARSPLGTLADHARRGEFEAQAMHETLARSTLGALAAGDAVNLELALRADGRLGGHIVQGHVDGMGAVVEIRDEGFSRVIAVDCDPALLPFVVEKGSIALDGVSLTVSALREHGFEVSLIPETLQRTTLAAAAVGRAVNVEVDILAKHVQRLLGAQSAAC